MPVITPLPTPPSSTDPSNFATRADAYLVAQNAMVTELNNAFNQIALNIIPGGATPGILSTTGVATFEVVASGYNAFSTTRAHGTGVTPAFNLERSRGTDTSPTAVQTGDGLGAFNFRGRDASGYVTGGQVRGVVNGSVTSGCVPTDIFVATTSAGGALTDRVRIGTDGVVSVSEGGTWREVGWREQPIEVVTVDFTFALTQRTKTLLLQKSGAQAVTIPNSSSVSFPTGSIITLLSTATSCTVTPAGGVTLRKAGTGNVSSVALSNTSWARLIYLGSNIWIIDGAGVT